MGQSRGLGSSKVWLQGKRHSFVQVSDVEETGEFKVTFQNEKYETKTLTLDAEALIQRAGLKRFMGV